MIQRNSALVAGACAPRLLKSVTQPLLSKGVEAKEMQTDIRLVYEGALQCTDCEEDYSLCLVQGAAVNLLCCRVRWGI